MKTLLQLGPRQHGKRLTLEEYLHANYQAGYQYEPMDGRLYVVPQANAPHGVNEFWLWV